MAIPTTMNLIVILIDETIVEAIITMILAKALIVQWRLNLVVGVRNTDERPQYEFPWHRDNYYALEAYIPNRKWSKEHEKWVYYAGDLHQRDLQWAIDRWTPGEHEGTYARLWKELANSDKSVMNILERNAGSVSTS